MSFPSATITFVSNDSRTVEFHANLFNPFDILYCASPQQWLTPECASPNKK